MSAAPASAAAAPSGTSEALPAVPAYRGKKKKLILIAAALAVVLAVGASGAAYYMIKKRAAAAATADGDTEAADSAEAEADGKGDENDKPVKASVKNAPTFVPLDPFTVNLADRDAERYAQVGISLELVDAKAGELLKAYMPAIRNNILLALGSKTAAQLNERDGKLRLAAEIRREALRPLGYELVLPAITAPGVAARNAAAKADDDEEPMPIRAVHFSNFIIQ